MNDRNDFSAMDPPHILDDRAHAARAADPGEYLTYEAASLPTPAGPVQIYAARRIGMGHILRGQPCQDHCLHRAFPGGIALAMADGISECIHGGKGAQLACEAAADLAEDLFRRCGDTEAFARALCDAGFHSSLRDEWLRRVYAHQQQLGARPSDEALLQYGTTLMLAVITQDWFAAISIGDGQVLFFSETEIMPLNTSMKDSPAPHSLIYPDCIQHIRSGYFPRRAFSGVLLTTDGVNDMLDRLGATAAHAYALQIAARFRRAGMPLQPFVYSGEISGEQRTVDLSRQLGAADDCTLMLALCSDASAGDAPQIHAQLKSRLPGADDIRLLRRSGHRAGYLVSSPTDCWLVTVIPQHLPRALRDPRLTHFREAAVRQWPGALCWISGGMRYTAYLLAQDASLLFLGEISHNGGFSDGCADGPAVVQAFRTLTALQRHLACQGLYLHVSAPWWIAQLTGHGLLIPQEALTEDPRDAADLRSLFPGLIGWLSCSGNDLPLFDPGAVSPAFPPPVHAIADSAFCIRYSAVQRAYGITNCGGAAWDYTDHQGQSAHIAPGRTLTLSDGRCFDVPAKQGTIRCTVRLLPQIHLLQQDTRPD